MPLSAWSVLQCGWEYSSYELPLEGFNAVFGMVYTAITNLVWSLLKLFGSFNAVLGMVCTAML